MGRRQDNPMTLRAGCVILRPLYRVAPLLRTPVAGVQPVNVAMEALRNERRLLCSCFSGRGVGGQNTQVGLFRITRS
jgi:hypothetical protein